MEKSVFVMNLLRLAQRYYGISHKLIDIQTNMVIYLRSIYCDFALASVICSDKSVRHIQSYPSQRRARFGTICLIERMALMG